MFVASSVFSLSCCGTGFTLAAQQLLQFRDRQAQLCRVSGQVSSHLRTCGLPPRICFQNAGYRPARDQFAMGPRPAAASQAAFRLCCWLGAWRAMPFITEDFLLNNRTAKRLYRTFAEGEPILDYH